VGAAYDTKDFTLATRSSITRRTHPPTPGRARQEIDELDVQSLDSHAVPPNETFKERSVVPKSKPVISMLVDSDTDKIEGSI
jgi:hypothetical protein